MNALRATFRLYGRCLADAARDMPRSWPAMIALVVYSALLIAIGHLLAALGMAPGASFAAGFVVALVHAGCVGSYLCLVETCVIQKQRVRFGEIQESFGTYLWEVISILFLFFIAELVVLAMLRAFTLWAVLMVVATVAFNPAPELIYQGRARGMELLREAAVFVRRAGLEWFAPQLLLVGALLFWQPALWAFAAKAFGPFFGFLEAGDLFFASVMGRAPTPLEIGLLVGSVLVTHFVMLFRGHLYQGLDTGGRRARAWREKFRD